jgi:hypothetical protein
LPSPPSESRKRCIVTRILPATRSRHWRRRKRQARSIAVREDLALLGEWPSRSGSQPFHLHRPAIYKVTSTRKREIVSPIIKQEGELSAELQGYAASRNQGNSTFQALSAVGFAERMDS